MTDVNSMRSSVLRVVRANDSIEYVIPASTFQNDAYAKEKYFFLKTGKATPHNKLSSEAYCGKVGGELYAYLVQHTPVKIFEAFVKRAIKKDITCNNYCAGILGMSKIEVYNKYKTVLLKKRMVYNKKQPGCGN